MTNCPLADNVAAFPLASFAGARAGAGHQAGLSVAAEEGPNYQADSIDASRRSGSSVPATAGSPGFSDIFRKIPVYYS